VSTPSVIVLPGDGIGPEVTAAAVRVLETLGIAVDERLFGGAAIDAMGDPLPAGTLEACRVSDAVLLGAVGGPKWDGGDVRPEAGLMGLRKALDVFANLRPAVEGDVDLLIVRELVGGLYFGARGVRDDGTVFDTLEYHPAQIERVARRAFELARTRRGEVCSVDKANVLDTSRLWRRVVTEVAADYPDVELRHALVDSTAMELVTNPQQFDVVLTENTFGDILSDVAAAVTGGLGVAASASLGDDGPGIFEPVHGSAPDIAGRGIANPIGQIWSGAMMLDHFGESAAASAVERAIAEVLADGGTRTPDLGGNAGTKDLGAAITAAIR